MKKILVIFISWLVVVNIFALLANNRLSLYPDTAYDWIIPEYTFQVKDWNIINIHARWDSYWYLDIAKNGYTYQGEDQLSNIVFFPLYPVLVGVISSILIIDPILVGFIISSLFTLGAVIFLYLLIKDFHKDSDPYSAIIMFLVFPTAFFLNAVYSESAFIFFAIASFYFVRKDKLLLCGLFGFFAALSRLSGIFLVLPIAIEILGKDKNYWKSPASLSIVMIPLGTFAFFAYHYLTFGDFTLFFKVQSLWGRSFELNAEHLGLLTNTGTVNFIFDMIFVAISLFLAFFMLFKYRVSYGVYMLISILLPLSSGTFMSIGRYALTLFPIFILAGTIKNKHIYSLLLIISTLLFALYTILFVSHYWAG